MGDPISVTGLVLSLGAIIKTCYDYGKQVKHAQQQIISLCSELASLKSILADLGVEVEDGTIDTSGREFGAMLEKTSAVVDGLSKRLETKKSPKQRAVQSLKFPLDKDEINQALGELERLKSWFLLALMTEQRSVLSSHDKNLQALTGLVESDIASRKQLEDSKALRKLRELLAPVSPDVYHRKACESWMETGHSSWFLDGPVAEWLHDGNSESASRLKILVGKSGAGKTTLMSQTIERCKSYVKETRDVHFAYFYCSFNDASSQERRNILGSWLTQLPLGEGSLMQRSDSFSRDVDADIVADRLEAELRHVEGKVLLILDALNESAESMKLLQAVARLTSGNGEIRCLISTISVPPTFNRLDVVIDMPEKLVDQDIEGYIRAKHAQLPVLQGVSEDELLRALAPRAEHRMFRWVDCQMSEIAAQLTPKLVRKALKHLSGDLNETYASILSRVPKAEAPFVREALLWLSFSRRPLRLSELCEAVIVDADDRSVDDSCRISPRHRLIELCRGLVAWDRLSDYVYLAHNSIRTYLTGDDIALSSGAPFALEPDAAEIHLVRKCVTYLRFRDFRVGYCETAELRDVHARFPLLDYAATNWAPHAKRVQYRLKEQDLKLIEAFLPNPRHQGQGSQFTFWINCLIPTGRDREAMTLRSEPLYYLASYGLDVCIERLVSRDLVSKTTQEGSWYIDRKCGRKWSTALQVACLRGSDRTVEMLLTQGADPNSTNSDGRSCLFWALRNRRWSIVKLLRDHGAVPIEGDDDNVDSAIDQAKIKEQELLVNRGRHLREY